MKLLLNDFIKQYQNCKFNMQANLQAGQACERACMLKQTLCT